MFTSMSAYLFTGLITQVRSKSSCGTSGCADIPQVSDSCLSLIVHGGNAETAQSGFEAWLRRYGDVNLISTAIAKVVAAPMMEQMLTEADFVPIDWSKIAEQMQAASEGIVVDDFEQGYWVDADKVISLENLSPDVASLQRDLDEEISSGLNWAAEKQFYFLISVLSSSPPPPEFTDETEADPENSAETQDGDTYEAEMENAEAENTRRGRDILARRTDAGARCDVDCACRRDDRIAPQAFRDCTATGADRCIDSRDRALPHRHAISDSGWRRFRDRLHRAPAAGHAMVHPL